MTTIGTSKIVVTDRAPAPAGHYSQAILSAGFQYIAGQLPIGSDGETFSSTGFAAQARKAIANMLAILEAAGGVPGQLVKVTAYIVDVGHWSAFDAVFAEMLPGARPSRTVVPVADLHHGFLVEIDAVAFVGTGS